MKASLMAVVALLLCVACANPKKTDPEPVQWRGSTIEINAPRAEVLRIAGQLPDRTVPIVNDANIPLGEQWMFISRDPKDRRLLWVELLRGHVTRVWTEPMASAKD